ncbi:class I SAM-dependent methyltransferase [Luteimonas sp. MC1825]|uniref:class I SAM-dependent methyltransferase n=1 Tax=Luteimonas sp. MC1825 TaxID=2761107 RepID=UPI0016124EFF|nr:class I SAM-dependent methyltransferase [Luteimonas sp. MC1825]MBB6600003.1 class I SAM-dependent methyltransferase [Luteimonas sp. MC1825]QOC87706.1 class I SAM-dependent methyltransferase [Luteimonas sp. MC1825]
MRDYNAEFQDNAQRQYAYDFDAVVRGYLMRTLSPYFSPGGKALELGCFEGDSTRLLADHFEDLTVLEASGDLIAVARRKVPDVSFVHGTIETATLDPVYDAIFLVHTLEHLDAPVEAMTRIRQWLSPTGRFFVVVPNAQAASRQIAVRMGLIDTNHAVTEGERAHGHRCTYSLDTLEHDVLSAGLRVESRGGVMFKPFANFQFDRMIQNKVIDDAYLEGCYALGMQYPELTASIYLVCRGR